MPNLGTDTLLVDTASSNTWVGAAQLYDQTSTSVQTRDTVVGIVATFEPESVL